MAKNDVVKETEYNTKIKNIEDKIPDITNLATKTTLNAKLIEVKGDIPSTTNLATTAALTAVENKIPNFSNLVKNTDYNTEVNEIGKKTTDYYHDKYTTTSGFNKLTAENFAAELAQANLASKSDIANIVKKKDFVDKLKHLNKQVTSNKAKNLLVENELKKLQTFDSSLFIGQSYFNNDGAQLYLIPQSIYKNIATFFGLPNAIS